MKLKLVPQSIHSNSSLFRMFSPLLLCVNLDLYYTVPFRLCCFIEASRAAIFIYLFIYFALDLDISQSEQTQKMFEP